jgi:hypothetical protein
MRPDAAGMHAVDDLAEAKRADSATTGPNDTIGGPFRSVLEYPFRQLTPGSSHSSKLLR